jgi:hypothetical protein
MRKAYPFYGKFSYRISVRSHDRFIDDYERIKNYLNDNYTKDLDFKYRDSWNIYLRDEPIYADVVNNFKPIIVFAAVPAPGYENLKGRAPKPETKLWYKKFPYKITVRDPDKVGDSRFSIWCESNVNYEYKKSGTFYNLSYFFINAADAMAFKLTFHDDIVNVDIIKDQKAEALLKQRIDDAKADLDKFMEGLGDDNGL